MWNYWQNNINDKFGSNYDFVIKYRSKFNHNVDINYGFDIMRVFDIQHGFDISWQSYK